MSSSVSGWSDPSWLGADAWPPMLSSPPPPRDMPPPRPPPLPRSTTLSQRTLVLFRLMPSLSVYSSVWMRPSTYTCFPLTRYSLSDSAGLPHRSTLCHSVRSCRWPALSFHTSVVAMLNFATGAPPGVKRSSASRPRLPTRITLFTEPIESPSGSQQLEVGSEKYG